MFSRDQIYIILTLRGWLSGLLWPHDDIHENLDLKLFASILGHPYEIPHCNNPVFVGQGHTPEKIVKHSKRFAYPHLSKKEKKKFYIILNHLYNIWWFNLIRQICYYHWKREKWPSKLVALLANSAPNWIHIILYPAWLLGLEKNIEKQFSLLVAISHDRLWWIRNKPIFENTSFNPLTRTSFNFTNLTKQTIWNPPSIGWLKFNFDLASPSKGSFIASVNRDSSGTITSIITTSESTNSLAWAVAKAALLAVNTTKDIGCNLFIFFKGMQNWLLTALTTHPYLQARKWAHFRWLYRNAMSTTFS